MLSSCIHLTQSLMTDTKLWFAKEKKTQNMFQYWWDGDHHTYRKTCSAWWCNLFQFKLPQVPIKVDLNDDMHPCFTLGTPSLLAQLLYQGTGRQPFLQELWSGVLSQMFLAIPPAAFRFTSTSVVSWHICYCFFLPVLVEVGTRS